MEQPRNVITISYGRQLFDESNPEHRRHVEIARSLGSLDMVVFTLKEEGHTVLHSQAGLTIHPTNSRSKWFMFFDAIKVASRLIKASIETPIVTTQDPGAAGLIGLWLRLRHGVHLVVQEHLDILGAPYWRTERFRNQIEYRISCFVLRRADVIRTVAKRIEPAVRAIGATAPVTQLPVSIDPSPFVAARASRPHHSGTFEYVTVARLVSQKNFPLLLDAFAAAYERNNKLCLHIVGKGPEQGRILAQIKKLFPSHDHPVPPVRMTDWTDDVPAVLREADAYVLSSNYEGWGRVLIEAVVAELPIVTTDVGCVGEVIHHEKTALVVPVDDKERLTDALVRLSTDTELYKNIVVAERELSAAGLPGTDIVAYGKAWRDTLTPSK